jgi:DNA polymerase III delta prime subunit
MGIEDARSLSVMQQNRSLDGGRKVFVVSTDSLTHEAQNSLLKVLEEPTEGTHFFFIMPTSERLLPTLASRLQVVKFKGDAPSLHNIGEFLAGTPAERMEFLKNILEEKDKSGALNFVGELENMLHKKIDLAHASADEIFALAEIEKGRQYLLDRSPSIKLILEHIALIVPVFK